MKLALTCYSKSSRTDLGHGQPKHNISGSVLTMFSLPTGSIPGHLAGSSACTPLAQSPAQSQVGSNSRHPTYYISKTSIVYVVFGVQTRPVQLPCSAAGVCKHGGISTGQTACSFWIKQCSSAQQVNINSMDVDVQWTSYLDDVCAPNTSDFKLQLKRTEFLKYLFVRMVWRAPSCLLPQTYTLLKSL